MKRICVICIVASFMLTLIVACVKDLGKEGIYTETEIVGTVVEKSTNSPLQNIKVQVTDGNRIHASATTGSDGTFQMKVNFNEVNDNYYLLLDGSPDLPSKQEVLRGMGKAIYDYKTLVLYDQAPIDMYNSLPTFTFSGHTYRVAPPAPTPLMHYEAVGYCDDLTLLYSDWRLPTKDELKEMYLNRNNIGGFNTGKWWSSTWTGSHTYSVVDFSNGNSATENEVFQCYVRPIRIEN